MEQPQVTIGIIIALLMAAAGIFLMLKKPKKNNIPTPETLSIEPQSQQPVVPRHLRQNLAESAVPSQPQNTNTADTVTAQITPPHSSEQTQAEIRPDVTNSEAPTSEAVKTDLPTEDIAHIQQQLAEEQQLVAEAEQHSEQVQTVAETVPDDEPAAVTDTEIVEKSAINEWDGSSDILDAHLQQKESQDHQCALATAQDFVEFYLYSNIHRALSGEQLVKILQKYGLRYGEMSCFHRYQDPEKDSPLMFSVLRLDANREIKNFDLEELPKEVCGLAFFLALPNRYAVEGYDQMVSLSQLIARDIGGLLTDQDGNELTQQLKEHWRHFVIEYRPSAG